jgi:hypothetical protein
MERRPGFERWLSLSAGAVLAAGLVGCYRNDYPAYPSTFTSAVAAVDLNGDGKVDLASANQPAWGGNGFVSVRLQDPTRPGGFQPPLRSAAGPNPGSLAFTSPSGPAGVAVVINQPNGAGLNPAYTVSVLLPGTAAGTFQAPVTLQLGSRYPGGAAVGALTAAGGADVAVAADGGSDLLVFFQGSSPGSYGAPVSLTVGGVPTSVAMADLRGNGLTDLVVATTGNLVSVLLQDPANPGSFLPHVDYPAGSYPVAVSAAALTGGVPDLVVADYGTGSAPTTQGLGVLLHDPANPGGFLPLASYNVGDYRSTALAVGDLNGDGRPDIVVANYGLQGSPGSVSVFFQQPGPPAGTFSSPTLYPGFTGPTSVAIGDFNGDGLPDLAIADGIPAVRFQLAGQPGVFGPEIGYAQ